MKLTPTTDVEEIKSKIPVGLRRELIKYILESRRTNKTNKLLLSMIVQKIEDETDLVRGQIQILIDHYLAKKMTYK